MSISVSVVHRTLPGMRDQLKAIWEAHMPAAVLANAGHEAYYYGLDHNDPDVIRAYQVYADNEAAAAFIRSQAYLDYVAASRHFLIGEPDIAMTEIIWSKGGNHDV